MADTTLEYNFQQCHIAVLAQESLAEQLRATIAQQAAQVADLRKRLDALAHEAQVTLTVPPPPDSEVVAPQPAPQVQPQRVDPSARPDHVSIHTTQPVPPSVPRTPSRSGRSSEPGPAQSQPQAKDKDKC